MSWLKKLAQAIKTKDEDALAKLIDEAPDMPSDGMPSIPGSSITINIPSQATALPEGNRTTTDEGDPNKDKTGTGDEEIPAWAKALLARLEKLEGKTTDGDPDPGNMTTDEDEEENRKVTGDAAFKRNLITAQNVIITLQRSNVRTAVCQQDAQHRNYNHHGNQCYRTPCGFDIGKGYHDKNRARSASRLRASPFRTLPPALFQRRNSSAAPA